MEKAKNFEKRKIDINKKEQKKEWKRATKRWRKVLQNDYKERERERWSKKYWVKRDKIGWLVGWQALRVKMQPLLIERCPTIVQSTIAQTTIAQTTIAQTTIAQTVIAQTTIAQTTIVQTRIAQTTITVFFTLLKCSGQWLSLCSWYSGRFRH